MEKKQNKVVEFVKTHKKEILVGVITTVTAVGGIVMFVMGNKKPKFETLQFNGVISTPDANDIQIADWSTGILTDCWRENGWINLIAKDFTVADAGKLGEELLKIDGVTSDTVLQTVMSLEDVAVN